MSGQKSAGVPGVYLAHSVRVGRVVRRKRGTDVPHEGQGRLGRGPQSQHPGRLVSWITEAVPVPAGGHEHRARRRLLRLAITDDQQPSAEHVDGLVETIVRVRDRPGEPAGDGPSCRLCDRLKHARRLAKAADCAQVRVDLSFEMTLIVIGGGQRCPFHACAGDHLSCPPAPGAAIFPTAP